MDPSPLEEISPEGEEALSPTWKRILAAFRRLAEEDKGR